MMTKDLLKKISLWSGINKEIREAIEYSVREGKTDCELWFNDDTSSKRFLKELGFEIEVVVREKITWEYIHISWGNLPDKA